VVAAAKKEGQVFVRGGPGAAYATALTDGFKKSYPDIKVNFTGVAGRDAIQKILREREAGLFNWDVYVGGTQSVLQTLRPAGAFEPLRPALMLPEVLDDKAWRGGLDSGWQDNDKIYALAFQMDVSPLAMVNWDFVSKDQLKTVADLLKPEFADKIVWDDPRLSGQGINAAQTLLLNFGPEFLAKLTSQQKIVYSTSPRQSAEWVVRGQYPIGIATAMEEFTPFFQRGLAKNVSVFKATDQAQQVAGPGFGTVSLMNRAPNPNAAKVYINWLLSKAGQTEWLKTGHNSRRLDVSASVKETYPEDGVTYSDTQSEAQIPAREEATRITRENIK